MDSIILYSLHCPKCKVLELKLQKAGIEFTIIDNEDTVVEVGKANHILDVPILQVGDNFYNFTNAVKYINERI